MATWVLTVLGLDRPGLVDTVSGVIYDHGGNWERSQMARMSGRFAGIVEVSVADDRAADLRAALEALPLHLTIDDTGAEPALAGRRFVLHMVGSDRLGLVHSVAGALAAVGASIDDLETETRSAPMAGGLLFDARATVVLPAGVDIESVRAELEVLADRLMVDIEFTD
jgi:glycine cleavage system regulatory protein